MRFTLLILGSLFSAYASAGVYKCTAPDGNTVYQSSPCNVGQSKVQINPKTGVSTDLNEIQNKQLSEQQEQQEQLAKQKAEEEQRTQREAELKRNASNESEKNQQLIKNNPEKFSAYAIPPYTPDALPPLVKGFRERLPEIERFRREAADKILSSEECGRVEAAELSSKSAKNALVILIDCSSGKHFYVSEQELPPPSQQQQQPPSQ